MKPELSIIVPIYNAEKYLERCIQSIIDQTYSNFELLLVDDGSSDTSIEICRQFEKADSRVKVITQKNAGVSAARNTGLDNAKGVYIGFIDSDDYIEKDFYEILYTHLVNEQADMSVIGAYDIYANKKPKKKEQKYLVLDQERATELILEGNLVSVHPWSKLCKRELFDGLRYPVGKIHEDSYVIIELLLRCQKIVVDTIQKYHYYHRVGSITSTTFAEKDLSFIDAWEKNYVLIVENLPNLKNLAVQRVCWANFLMLDKIMVSDNEKNFSQTQEIINYLKKHSRFILQAKSFTRNRKISLIALLISPSLYKKFAKAQENRVTSKNS